MVDSDGQGVILQVSDQELLECAKFSFKTTVDKRVLQWGLIETARGVSEVNILKRWISYGLNPSWCSVSGSRCRSLFRAAD